MTPLLILHSAAQHALQHSLTQTLTQSLHVLGKISPQSSVTSFTFFSFFPSI